MKYVLFFLISISTTFANAANQSYADVLASNQVNHFQLLVNNLNMLFITKMDDFKKSDPNKEKELKTTFIKVSSTKDNKLIFSMFYEAPVGLISRAKCNDQLESDLRSMLGEDSKVSTILQLLSFYPMSKSEADSMLRDSYLNMTITASENKELNVSCSK
ncbi:hypothetical protein QX776_09475 [Alteromonadaceae bacterium BrNp21-10]|nr:hypothetical protein [Alteromonadaceae bacterium BrNp21-10]